MHSILKEDEMEKFLGGLIVSLGIAAMVIILAILFALPVYWLWNWLMPIIFGLKEITFWQAWGLNVLCGFLFKGTFSSSSK